MKVKEDNVDFESENLQVPTDYIEDIQVDETKRALCCKAWMGVAQVTPHLYLCGAAAVNPAMLRALRVTCVINAAAELPPTPTPSSDIRCLRVDILDTPNTDILQHMDQTIDAIEEVQESGGCTLVHCVAGVSRSAALCLGYLMRCEQLTLRDAFRYLRSKRPAVRPNCGFFRQLIEYERKLSGANTVEMVYNEVTCSHIPDVYEQEYHNTLCYQQHYNRRFGRN